MSGLGDMSMLELFRTEVETQAGILVDGLLTLEQQGGSGDVCEPLMRAAHSIKGAARIVSLDPAVQVAHAMEDVLSAAQHEKLTLSADAIDVLLGGVDLLKTIAAVNEQAMGDWPEEHAEQIETMVQTLRSIQAGESPSPVEPAAPSPPSNAKPEPAADPGESSAPAEEQTPPDSEPKASSSAPATTGGEDRVVRVSAENMTRLMGLAGQSLVQTNWFESFARELVELKSHQLKAADYLDQLRHAAQNDQLQRASAIMDEMDEHLSHVGEHLAADISEFEDVRQRMTRVTETLYREVIQSRMRPFADGVGGFPRMVRDLARQLGKQVSLTIEGRQTRVDRDILEKLEGPLTHLLRNAVDHGLESPHERGKAGKTSEGHLTLSASHRAGMLHIELRDDGRGVDLDELRSKIVDRGHASAAMVAEMTAAELLEFLFLPGFTTRGDVSDVSGRGVGLDVVRSMVQEVAGLVEIDSVAGQGTTFHLQLPLTLSVIRALVVEIGGDVYALPLFRVDRCLSIERDELQQVENRQYIVMDEDNVGLVSARQLLDVGSDGSGEGPMAVVVVSDRQNRYGLEVDRFLMERDLVVRPLDARLGNVPDVAAAATLDDGTPLLILDVDDLVRSADELLTTGRLRKVSDPQVLPDRESRRILVVDDSITVREVQRRLLEQQGYTVDTAVDGADGLNTVTSGSYDLLITDVDMPRMDGIELIRRVRQEPALKDLPVMIVSYKDRQDDRMAGLEAGANYYLTKSSFHDATLLDAVKDLIGEA